MIKKINFLFFALIFVCNSYGQEVNSSHKIVLSSENYTTISTENGNVAFHSYHSRAISDTSYFLLFNVAKQAYSGPFSYNPPPFDMNTGNALTFFSMASLDQVWTNSSIVNIAKRDSTKALNDKNFDMQMVGGIVTPLSYEMELHISGNASTDQELFYDLSVEGSIINLFIYSKRSKKLQIWSIDSNVKAPQKSMVAFDEFKKFWKNRTNVSIDLLKPFAAFSVNGKDYIISSEGNFYSIGSTAKFITKLAEPLDDSAILLDKDNNQVYYLPNWYKTSKPKHLSKVAEFKKIKLQLD